MLVAVNPLGRAAAEELSVAAAAGPSLPRGPRQNEAAEQPADAAPGDDSPAPVPAPAGRLTAGDRPGLNPHSCAPGGGA